MSTDRTDCVWWYISLITAYMLLVSIKLVVPVLIVKHFCSNYGLDNNQLTFT